MKRTYWQENLRLVGICLLVWFSVSLGCGVLLVDYLNQFHLGGMPLGFWFAQQGSIYAFLVLIFVYALAMARIAKSHGASEEDDAA